VIRGQTTIKFLCYESIDRSLMTKRDGETRKLQNWSDYEKERLKTIQESWEFSCCAIPPSFAKYYEILKLQNYKIYCTVCRSEGKIVSVETSKFLMEDD